MGGSLGAKQQENDEDWGGRAPTPSVHNPRKTHTTIFLCLSLIQRTLKRPLHSTPSPLNQTSPTLPQTLPDRGRKGMETKKTRASLRFSQFFRVITIYRIVSGFVTYK